MINIENKNMKKRIPALFAVLILMVQVLSPMTAYADVGDDGWDTNAQSAISDNAYAGVTDPHNNATTIASDGTLVNSKDNKQSSSYVNHITYTTIGETVTVYNNDGTVAGQFTVGYDTKNYKYTDSDTGEKRVASISTTTYDVWSAAAKAAGLSDATIAGIRAGTILTKTDDVETIVYYDSSGVPHYAATMAGDGTITTTSETSSWWYKAMASAWEQYGNGSDFNGAYNLGDYTDAKYIIVMPDGSKITYYDEESFNAKAAEGYTGYVVTPVMEAIAYAFGWAGGADEFIYAMMTHMAKYLQKAVDELTEEDIEKLLEDDEFKNELNKDLGTDNGQNIDHISGKLTPDYYTYNTSDEYNLGEGIPSSKTFTNGVKADTWYGEYGWKKVEGSRKINVTVTYSGTWHHYVDENGNPPSSDQTATEGGGSGTEHTYHDEDYTWSKSYSYVVERAYLYYYLAYLETYQLQSLTVQNGCFDSDKIYSGAQTITVEALHDDADMGSMYAGGSDYLLHTQWQEFEMPEKNCGYVDSGSVNPSEADIAALAEGAVPPLLVKNDLLKTNNVTYMNDAWVEMEGDMANKMRPTDYPGGSYIPSDEAGNPFVTYSNTQQVTIPAPTENGKYSTTLIPNYAPLKPTTGTNIPGIKSGKSAILPGYEGNEPVVVHTPVISPVKITTGDTAVSDTQLTHKDSSSFPNEWNDLDYSYYLRLDNTYTFEFEPFEWVQDITGMTADDIETVVANGRNLKGYAEDGEEKYFDEFIKWKRVRFPFDVEINGIFYTTGDKGTTYYDAVSQTTEYYTDAKNGQTYTKWIYLTASDHDFDFYIPTWAYESTTMWPDNSDYYKVQYQVAALNTIDQFGSNHAGATEDTENGKWNPNEVPGDDPSRYVATYEIAANVSGWIYDFQIVGTTNGSLYWESPYEDDTNENYSFALHKEEKKSGVYNRTGTKDIRYDLDGEVTSSWNILDTIALSKGRSKRYTDMGGAFRGQSVNFIVRTIANLEGENDYITINPTLRYVTKDGTSCYDNEDDDPDNDIQIYYNTKDHNNFVRYGSGTESLNSVQLGDQKFYGSYYDGRTESHGNDDLTYSANKYYSSMDNPVQYYLKKEIPSYTVTSIKLYDTLRLLDGNLEKLSINLSKQPTELQDLTYYGSLDNIITSDIKLHDSMQTWYGQYWIPDEIYIVTEEELSRWTEDHDGDGDIDLDDYSKQHWVDPDDHSKGSRSGVTKDAEIWEKDGYLVVNFPIDTHNDGADHLSYGGMWNNEATGDYDGSIPKIETGGTPDIDIPAKPGDVILVELSNSVQDKYSTRILFID